MTENTQEEQILVFQPARIIKFTKCVLGEGGVSGGRKHVVACLYDQKSMWGVQIPTQIIQNPNSLWYMSFKFLGTRNWQKSSNKSKKLKDTFDIQGKKRKVVDDRLSFSFSVKCVLMIPEADWFCFSSSQLHGSDHTAGHGCFLLSGWHGAEDDRIFIRTWMFLGSFLFLAKLSSWD